MSLPVAEREALAAALAGADTTLESDATREVDGVQYADIVAPASGAALAASLAALSQLRQPVCVEGGGNRIALGGPVSGAAVLLSTARLRGILTVDADDGVLCALAGTPLAELRAAAQEAGWELPLDPPGETSTLGGALAAAAIGPRFGPPRSVVLGLELVSAAGTPTRCGGRVVKNVTGYDLAKLYTGSLGTLAVIEAAWIRLRPLPERTRALAAPLPVDEGADDRVLVASRLPGVRAAAATADQLLFELAGEAGAVERSAADLAGLLDVRAAGDAAFDTVGELQASPDALLFRIAHLPTRAAAVRAALPGPVRLSYPARGLLYVALEAEDAEAAARCCVLVAAAAELGGGSWQRESGPRWAREPLGADASDPAWRLMRALKDQYDPEGILNPGRLRGHG